MSVRHTLRALPAVFRLSLAEATAFRAEMVIWILSTTMPLIMLPLWHAVAEEAPVHGYGGKRFTAYFVIAFAVRQLTSAWASWTFNWEVRTGVMSMRLLRPIHPLWAYAAENIGALPIRLVVALPVLGLAYVATDGAHMPRDPWIWCMAPVAVAGAWAITFLAHICVGILSFWTDSSIKVMDVWVAGFFVFSGYLVPVALFPPWLRGVPAYLPFESQLGFPVELLSGSLQASRAALLLGKQWLFVAALAGLAALLWRHGVKRYAAFGG